MTGARLDAADVVALGLATHCVASSSIDEIRDALAALDGDQPPEAFADAVDATLRRFQIAPPGASTARARADAIDACFSEPDISAILSALDRNGDAFCAEAAASIRRGPVSKLVLATPLRPGTGRWRPLACVRINQ